MLIRTHLAAESAAWGDALLGTPPRSEDKAGIRPDTRVDAQAAQNRLQTARQQQDLALIRKLEARDREVHAHEQAHASVGGQYAGTATFTYQRGPDGVLYAIGGEVSIDISPVSGNPQATLDKAEQVRRAALAPRDPSSTDRRVAQRAQGLARAARQALAELAAIARETAQTPENKATQPGQNIDTSA